MRPKGYEIPKLENGIYTAQQMVSYGESRVDAMLEGLRKNQVTVPDILYWWTTVKGREERKKGILIFIPEEGDER